MIPGTDTASLDAPETRGAGRELLSLALMDARNHTLYLLRDFEQALGPALEAPRAPRMPPPAWRVGHAGWLAEAWIGRNPQRGLGAACPPDAVRLASIEPRSDGWFDPLLVSPSQRWDIALPSPNQLRAYLLETLEDTLELLEKTQPDDASLYFFRMALFHEDLRGEQLVAQAQQAGVALGLPMP
ncbi:DinB family protein, partial [Ramlibacter sp.]|uniref:DinB family protein n=1 Tax=Ramlibacter sp. TaxID=1917967 RepID=UPI0017F5A119